VDQCARPRGGGGGAQLLELRNTLQPLQSNLLETAEKAVLEQSLYVIDAKYNKNFAETRKREERRRERATARERKKRRERERERQRRESEERENEREERKNSYIWLK